MSWLEIHIKTTNDHAHALGDELAFIGAQAVTFHDAGDQPIYEPDPNAMALWPETVIVGLFNYTTNMQPIIGFLEQQQAHGLIHQFHIEHVADRDWERICLEHFKPIQCGKRLWICPSWHTPPDSAAVNVILDPGLAFGTGTHPTTFMCLEWLDTHITGQEQVIDYGCGSGILGIAAIKLGAQHVLAIDNDPQALQATTQNSQRNHIEKHALSTHFPNEIKQLDVKCDILIANILMQPLIELAAHFATLSQSQSKILLSGILVEQVDLIREAYQPWFNLTETKARGEWALLAGTHK